MTTWTIIGGGLQDVNIAMKLRSKGLKVEQLNIIDPNSNLCAQFNDYTKRIDMPYLRSPCVHHVHPNPFHLKQYAKRMQYAHGSYGPYKRPNRNMFMDHTHNMIHHFELNKCHIKSYAKQITKKHNKWLVRLQNNEWLHTDYLIIAFGCNHDTYTPQIFEQAPDVSHIFDNDVSHYSQTSHVVGSGISAAHLTIRLLKENSNTVHLWMNKNIAVHDFDADPAWLGPKNMTSFQDIQSSKKRLDIIKQERHKGSMPKELELRLKKYVKQKRLIIHINEILEVRDHHIITENDSLFYDHILLATGFKNTIMQQPIITQLISHFQAPITTCGLPWISPTLEWLPNLFVSGGLADLELGPFARNIMGGREAALRISQAYDKIKSTTNIKRAI